MISTQTQNGQSQKVYAEGVYSAIQLMKPHPRHPEQQVSLVGLAAESYTQTTQKPLDIPKGPGAPAATWRTIAIELQTALIGGGSLPVGAPVATAAETVRDILRFLGQPEARRSDKPSLPTQMKVQLSQCYQYFGTGEREILWKGYGETLDRALTQASWMQTEQALVYFASIAQNAVLEHFRQGEKAKKANC